MLIQMSNVVHGSLRFYFLFFVFVFVFFVFCFLFFCFYFLFCFLANLENNMLSHDTKVDILWIFKTLDCNVLFSTGCFTRETRGFPTRYWSIGKIYMRWKVPYGKCMHVCPWVHTEEFTFTLVSGLGQQDSTVKKKDWEAYMVYQIL